MTRRQNFILILAALNGLLVLGLVGYFLYNSTGLPASAPQPKSLPVEPTPTPQDVVTAAIDRALQAATKRYPEEPVYLIYRVAIDHVVFSSDGSLALAWLALVDRETGQVSPGEPGLAIARRTIDNSTSAPLWQITLQLDADWREQLDRVPASLLDDATRQLYSGANQPIPHDGQVFTGYRLPWRKGLAKTVTGSIGHVFTYKSCPATCLYAFDFADGTMFPILAARSGKVKYAVWQNPNNNHTSANYLILEDDTTIPVTYQVYFHLAQDSIPAALRVKGAEVTQGQFLGNADNTGYSTGSHLHFHVHTNPNLFWGTSVDISFDDVTINGGRPRTCAEAKTFPAYGSACHTGDRLVSGNSGDTLPPTAGITAPAGGTTVTDKTMDIGGWGKDENGLSRLQLISNYDGVWRPLGIAQTVSPFTQTVDLCQAGIPDGDFSVALRVWDRAGNQSAGLPGLRQFQKKYACPRQIPQCTPAVDQAAIFVNPDSQGACENLVTGNYPDLTAFPNFGNDNLESVTPGSNVNVVLYEGSNYTGRQETLSSAADSLQEHRIAPNQVSSLRVRSADVPPAALSLVLPTNRRGTPPTSNDSLVLAWNGGEGAVDFRSELKGSSANSLVLDWTTEPAWSVGSLPAGDYDWTVWARNRGGQVQASLKFTVNPATTPAGVEIAPPLMLDFASSDGSWLGSGLWKWINIPDQGKTVSAWVYGNGKDYSDPAWHAGDLTSQLMKIPTSGIFVQVTYLPAVADHSPFYDRCILQISKDGGVFQDLVILPKSENSWQASPMVDLSPFAGSTIRLRFHFDTIDDQNNVAPGWAIGSIQITNDPEHTGCKDLARDFSMDSARAIAMDEPIEGQICPAGDEDYFSIESAKADRIAVVIQPEGEWLPVIEILARDGKTILTSSLPAADPDGVIRLGHSVPETGKTFIRIHTANPPSDGTTPSYRLQVSLDNTPPSLEIESPDLTGPAPNNAFNLTVKASDGNGSGISRVGFWWHPANWETKQWNLLGYDNGGKDGWSWKIDPAILGNLQGSALFIQAEDRAGNQQSLTRWVGQAATNVMTPVSSLETLSDTNQSTMIALKWSAAAGNGPIDHFEIQYRDDGSDWNTWEQELPAALRQAWFTGLPGHTYEFRLRALDAAGNAEPYTDNAEARTRVEESCQPDVFEPGDGTPAGASPLVTGAGQEHNLCPAGDEDWFAFKAGSGASYRINANPLSGGAAVTLQVIASDGITVLAEQKPVGILAPVQLDWKAPAEGTYFLHVVAAQPGIFGSQARYSLRVDRTGTVSVISVICGGLLIPLILAGWQLLKKLKTATPDENG